MCQIHKRTKSTKVIQYYEKKKGEKNVTTKQKEIREDSYQGYSLAHTLNPKP
jgi:hypothetical protein